MAGSDALNFMKSRKNKGNTTLLHLLGEEWWKNLVVLIMKDLFREKRPTILHFIIRPHTKLLYFCRFNANIVQCNVVSLEIEHWVWGRLRLSTAGCSAGMSNLETLFEAGMKCENVQRRVTGFCDLKAFPLKFKNVFCKIEYLPLIIYQNLMTLSNFSINVSKKERFSETFFKCDAKWNSLRAWKGSEKGRKGKTYILFKGNFNFWRIVCNENCLKYVWRNTIGTRAFHCVTLGVRRRSDMKSSIIHAKNRVVICVPSSSPSGVKSIQLWWRPRGKPNSVGISFFSPSLHLFMSGCQ